MSVISATDSSSGDTTTVIAVGVLAATLAAVCHETLGHGFGCIGGGGHITLLTSIWFRCSKWTVIADAGGPIGNLVAGSVAVVLLNHTGPRPTGRLFLFLFGALNLFWFTGQLTFESLTRTHDDWYWILSQSVIWRPVGALIGIGGYVLAIRCLSAVIRKLGGLQANAIRLAWAAAAGSAVIAGLMWHAEPLRSAFEGFLTLGIAPIGLSRLARRESQNVGHAVACESVTRSWVWISIGAML